MRSSHSAARAVAYALSYLVGTSFVVWFLSSLAPRLLRVDLRQEALKLEAEATKGSKAEVGTRSAYSEWDSRCSGFGDAFAGRTVAEVERSPRLACSSSASAAEPLLDTTPETKLELGYTVPYAIGNILLTAWGPVIVMLMR